MNSDRPGNLQLHQRRLRLDVMLDLKATQVTTQHLSRTQALGNRQRSAGRKGSHQLDQALGVPYLQPIALAGEVQQSTLQPIGDGAKFG